LINSGFMCPNCGPMKECSSKSIKKVAHLVCKRCEALVNKWERPLNERAGRCTNCAGCDFASSMGKDKLKGHLIRLCRICSEEYDIDAEKVLTPGKEEFKWKKQN
jgi:transcription elongation factor Elf1